VELIIQMAQLFGRKENKLNQKQNKTKENKTENAYQTSIKTCNW